MSASRYITFPALGLKKPVMRLRQVVLPAPFGPIRLTISPGLIAKLISDSAVRPPKFFETFLTSSISGGSHRNGSRAAW